MKTNKKESEPDYYYDPFGSQVFYDKALTEPIRCPIFTKTPITKHPLTEELECRKCSYRGSRVNTYRLKEDIMKRRVDALIKSIMS